MSKLILSMMLVVLAIASAASFAQGKSGVQDLSLNVAARQGETGTIGKWLHEFRLRCRGGNCELTIVTLNQCVKNPVGAPILVDTYSSEYANLRVRPDGTNAIFVEFDRPEFARLRFGFEVTPGGRSKVTSFSGGYSYFSVMFNRISYVEYVPLIGRYTNVTLDCAVELPGVEK